MLARLEGENEYSHPPKTYGCGNNKVKKMERKKIRRNDKRWLYQYKTQVVVKEQS